MWKTRQTNKKCHVLMKKIKTVHIVTHCHMHSDGTSLRLRRISGSRSPSQIAITTRIISCKVHGPSVHDQRQTMEPFEDVRTRQGSSRRAPAGFPPTIARPNAATRPPTPRVGGGGAPPPQSPPHRSTSRGPVGGPIHWRPPGMLEAPEGQERGAGREGGCATRRVKRREVHRRPCRGRNIPPPPPPHLGHSDRVPPLPGIPVRGALEARAQGRGPPVRRQHLQGPRPLPGDRVGGAGAHGGPGALGRAVQVQWGGERPLPRPRPECHAPLGGRGGHRLRLRHKVVGRRPRPIEPPRRLAGNQVVQNGAPRGPRVRRGREGGGGGRGGVVGGAGAAPPPQRCVRRQGPCEGGLALLQGGVGLLQAVNVAGGLGGDGVGVGGHATWVDIRGLRVDRLLRAKGFHAPPARPSPSAAGARASRYRPAGPPARPAGRPSQPPSPARRL